MLINSHLLIGKTIHKYILDNLGLKLSASNLMFGCVKPDFSPKLINISHYKSESFHIIAQMIISLQVSKFPDSQKELNYFSTQLGIILHYISDYFCCPHNNKLIDKMPDHFLYEVNLDGELKKYLSKSFDSTDLNLTNEDCANLEESLIQYIEDKHNHYLKENPSTSNDVYYALQVCRVVALKIITEAIVKAYPKVA